MRVKFVVQESVRDGKPDDVGSTDAVSWDEEMDRRDLPKRADSLTHDGAAFTVTRVTTGTFAGETHATLQVRRTDAA